MSSLLVGHTVQKVDTGGDVLAKLVLLILADYANSEGKAWPSLDTLAKQTGRSLASVKRARAKLVDLGLIEISDDQGYTLKYRGDQRPKVYDILPTVDMPERPARPAKKPAEHVPPERNQDPADDGSPVSPRSDSDGSPMNATTAHPCTERRLTHEPQTVRVNNKLFTNRQSEPTRASAHRPTTRKHPDRRPTANRPADPRTGSTCGARTSKPARSPTNCTPTWQARPTGSACACTSRATRPTTPTPRSANGCAKATGSGS
ncbi:cryptic prophage protein [Bifidobacterium pseudolongum subsp. globosum]|uniref:helix-turn-helix domain-containing protein n=1 Tax=Bifidobacterium pseudolongum TaxID=1694 RepID=UPI000C7140CD|nr:cryptic prophage protein [Bifidobacterium pseudolongum subsp. globosum]